MLKELPNTVVHCKTRKEFDCLMRIYEDAGWRLAGTKQPTSYTWERLQDSPARYHVTVNDRAWFPDINTRSMETVISLSDFLKKQGIKSTSSPNTPMEARTVYTHPDAKGVELWATPEGLSVRNGKRGKPVVLTVSTVDTEDEIAEAFFAGLTLNS